MAKFSRLEKAMALVIGIDIAAPGFSRAAAKQTVTALSRTAAYVAPRAAAAIPAAAAYSPVATGAALGLGALASPPGQTLLDIAEERGRMDRIRFEQAMTDLTQVAIPKAKKRTKSKFNKMVSSGMKTVRASKLELFPAKFGYLDQESTVTIFKTQGNTISSEVDFSNQDLIAASCLSSDNAETSPLNLSSVFDGEVFNQDIEICHNDGHADANPVNYYLELEKVSLDLHQASAATLKNIRNSA
jgi:hypothetical protein